MRPLVLYIENCKRILSEGVWDTDRNVRPRWEDGSPAHTVKLFGVVNRYDLSKEFPIMTLRRTYWKSAIGELLWIWQKKSNNVHDLNSHIWDSWADETGSIGKAYALAEDSDYWLMREEVINAFFRNRKRSEVLQIQHPAIAVAQLQIVAVLFYPVWTDIVPEIMTLAHHILRVKVEVRLLARTVKVMEDAQTLRRVQFHALGPQR